MARTSRLVVSKDYSVDYRIFTLDVDDLATSQQNLSAEDEAAAIAAAHALAGDHYAVEVWRVDGPLVVRLGGDVVPGAGDTDVDD